MTTFTKVLDRSTGHGQRVTIAVTVDCSSYGNSTLNLSRVRSFIFGSAPLELARAGRGEGGYLDGAAPHL